MAGAANIVLAGVGTQLSPYTFNRDPVQCIAVRWSIPPPGQNLAHEATIVTVTVDMRNYLNNGAVENHPGKMMMVAYPDAFKLARHRFNFKNVADIGTPWFNHNPTATFVRHIVPAAANGLPGVPNMGHQGYVVARGNRRIPFSMVSVSISGLPLEERQHPGIRVVATIGSRNVYIVPDNNDLTVRRLFTDMANRHFWGEEAHRQGSDEDYIFRVDPVNFRINFTFMFIKGPQWQPPIRANIVVFENNPNVGAMTRAMARAQAALAAAAGPAVGAPIAINQAPLAILHAILPLPNAVAAAANAHGHAVQAAHGRYHGRLRSSSGHVGAMRYADMKDRIYIRKNQADFFSSGKAAISVPVSQDGACFPMAFMRCQLRTWTHEVKLGVVGKMISIEEGGKHRISVGEDVITPVFPMTSFWNPETGVITVFDNTKKVIPRVGRTGRTCYLNEADDLPLIEKQAWLWCALQVHMFVETVVGQPVDLHDLGMCMSAYAYVFQVNMSMYAMEMKGDRVMIEAVENNTAQETQNFIAMIIQNTHVHAISSIREYRRSEINPTASCLHSYCDFCDTLRFDRNAKLLHVNGCYQNENWKICESLESMHRQESLKIETRVKYRCLRGEKSHQEMCCECLGQASTCPCDFSTTKVMNFVQCVTCGDEVPKVKYNDHDCFMKPRKHKDNVDQNKIFVYDIESMQEFNEEVGQYIHKVILICLRAVYDETRKWKFENIPDFIAFLMDNEEFYGSTVWAHNGGGYDHQFVLRYLESEAIAHSTIARPGTIHKYLLVEMTMRGEKTAIKFLDFLMLMSDSLRNIGEAFKLDVCKGDFPHRFSREAHLDYVGRIPEMDTEDDWYSFKEMKSEKELAACRRFWAAQSLIYCTCDGLCNCQKPPWNFKQELEAYCWKDVHVLAGACKAYRDQALGFSGVSEYNWSTNGIDPMQYMTQSQIALALFLEGSEGAKIAITHEKIRPSFNPKQLLWMEHLMGLPGNKYRIQHAGNCHKEYYDVSTCTYLDGYCPVTKTVFEYMDCYMDACPECYPDEIASKEIHPARGVPWDQVWGFTDRRLFDLRANNIYKDIVIKWDHDDTDYPEFEDRPSMAKIMKLRDFFYGGRCDVMVAYCNPAKFDNSEIKHIDVCSLYPTVCSFDELPVGIPKIYFNRTVDKNRLTPEHPDRYFGFVRVRVRPNPRDLIAILPVRLSNEEGGPEKLIYDLNEKEGCWHTELVYLAMEHGYEILEVYEVWHWPKSQRSTTLMRGYMEYFLRMKQEAEGWKKLGAEIVGDTAEKDITDEQKNQIMELIYNNNGKMARPRIDKVDTNPVLRQLAKIFLNCLWGKLCQKSASELERYVYGYKQYLEICSNPEIDPTSLRFRAINGDVYKVRYKVRDTLQESNRHLNVPIAASVTAHAQIRLMRKMFEIGPERIMYCDTDSIMAIVPKNGPVLSKSGLGNWADEHPGQQISFFYALAPKCYLMVIEGDHGQELHFKCKGVRSTEENREKTSQENIHELIQHQFFGEPGYNIIAKTMTIHPNSTNAAIPYGTMCTKYGEKRIQAVFSKRKLLVNDIDEVTEMSQMALVRLVPFGYEGDSRNEL